MVKTVQHLFFTLLIGACLVLPLLVAAAPTNPGPNPNAPPPNPKITNEYKLNNPIKVDSIQELLGLILQLVIIIATPIVVLFIIFAGFKYVTARGNASQIEEATKALTYAIIGGVLIIGAVAISKIIENLVNSF